MAPILLLLVMHIVISANGFSNPFLKQWLPDVRHAEASGSPLFLTPYLESGNIEEARNLSRVDFPGIPEVKSYAGFFTVDKTYNSNQFLWYFPPSHTRRNETVTVILWLQGGPGVSSLYGLFEENGPFEVVNNTFQKRELHWAIFHHVIYIDNPVGTGFSFTNDSRGYCTNQTQVAKHLYTTLLQFFQLFPELQKLDFFVSGESYAGKYVPALGYTIHKKNPSANLKINLKGLMIGNGLCDPINQLDYSDYLYQIGFADSNQKSKIEWYQNQTIELIKKEAWRDAFESYKNLTRSIQRTLAYVSIDNYLQATISDDVKLNYSQLIQDDHIRRVIHVGNLTYNKGDEVFEALSEDILKSVAPWISELLEHYYFLFYNGQVDIGSAYPLTVNFLKKLPFSGHDDYLKAPRIVNLVWFVFEHYIVEVGLSRNAGKLTEIMVRNAGHMVPKDQPIWIWCLLDFWRSVIYNADTERQTTNISTVIFPYEHSRDTEANLLFDLNQKND